MMSIFKVMHNLYMDYKMSKYKEFLIYDQDKPIAELKTPKPYDQPWFFYDLDPISSDKQMLDRLYSEEFWGSDKIHFYTKEDLISCEFYPAVYFFEKNPTSPDADEEDFAIYGWMDDDTGIVTALTDRPKKILLTGPYFEYEKSK